MKKPTPSRQTFGPVGTRHTLWVRTLAGEEHTILCETRPDLILVGPCFCPGLAPAEPCDLDLDIPFYLLHEGWELAGEDNEPPADPRAVVAWRFTLGK